MRGSAAPGRRRLRVQLRISNMRAPYGRSFWSAPLQLDSLGGAAIVSVPCPGPSPSYAQPDARAAYALSVTASQVALLLRQSGQAQACSPVLLVWQPTCISTLSLALRVEDFHDRSGWWSMLVRVAVDQLSIVCGSCNTAFTAS